MIDTIRQFEDDMEKAGYKPPFFLGLNSPNKIPFSAMFRGPFASAIGTLHPC